MEKLITIAGLCKYLNKDYLAAEKFAKAARAERRIGNYVLYSKVSIDQALYAKLKRGGN